MTPRFANAHGARSEAMKRAHVEAEREWSAMGQEGRRPFLQEYKAELERWRSLKAKNMGVKVIKIQAKLVCRFTTSH